MLCTVLVPLDGSALAEQALPVAGALARGSRADVELVLAARPGSAAEIDERMYVTAVAARFAEETGLSVNGVVRIGRPAEVICARALEIDADVIVMTSHGRTGLRRAWLGSVADEVIRRSLPPVLVVRARADGARTGGEAQFQKILVPLDGSTTSSAILEHAARLARAVGATLVLARVVRPLALYAFDKDVAPFATPAVDEDATNQLVDRLREDLTELAQRIEDEFDLHLETVVLVADRVGSGLLEIAAQQRADLIAMTTHSRGASRMVFGSVADELLRTGTLPLLVLHPHAVTRAGYHTEEWAHDVREL